MAVVISCQLLMKRFGSLHLEVASLKSANQPAAIFLLCEAFRCRDSSKGRKQLGECGVGVGRVVLYFSIALQVAAVQPHSAPLCFSVFPSRFVPDRRCVKRRCDGDKQPFLIRIGDSRNTLTQIDRHN